MNRYLISIFLLLTAVFGCGKQESGTIVRISNETRFTITDVRLITSTDTVSEDSISSSCIFEDTVMLHEKERVELSWIQDGEYREFGRTLIDSVNHAKIVMFSIPSNDDYFEVLYNF